MRILIRTSKWAIWSRRLASLAVPLLVIPVLLHRERLIESATFHVIAAVTLFVALIAFVSSIIALVRLWQSGDLGWGRAISAFFISLVCLAPFVWVGVLVERYPAATDVATAERSLMPLSFDAVTAAMAPPRPLGPAETAARFPNATTRDYPLSAGQAYELALRLVDQRGWDIRTRREPTGPFEDGLINARITELLGWRDEVVVRVTAGLDGASVDMRSVSLDAPHDLGSNGRRIEEFLTAFDAEVTVLLRDNPGITQPLEEAEIAPDAPDIAD